MKRLRQPAYTGSNRCVPCTVLNGFIAVFVSILLGVFLYPHLGGVLVLLSVSVFLFVLLVIIWLRGYLLPGTPTLTKRYFPPWLLAIFGHVPDDPFDETVELPETDLLEPCNTDTQYRLVLSIVTEIEDIVALLDVEHDADRFLAQLADIATLEREETYRATSEGAIIHEWNSEAALLTDIAIAEVLEWHVPLWNDLSGSERLQLIVGLRLLYERGRMGTTEACVSNRELRDAMRAIEAPGASQERII